jgi:tetratricopeptide (TPR) repeat protein
MNRLLSIALFVATLASASASAQDLVADLRAHRFDAVERPLQAAEDAFVANRLSEYDLLDAYKAFYVAQDVLSDDMAAWERERPNSWIARVASGTYHRKLGEIRRGQGYIQDVPPDDQQYMLRQFGLAQSELKRALQMNPHSYLAMLNLVNVAQFVSDDKLADRMLVLGNQSWPANLLIRARYLVHLAPRWGGSLRAIDAFIADTRTAHAPADVVRLLEAVGDTERGFVYETQGQPDRALEAYRRTVVAASRGGVDPRFARTYLLYALRHCDVDSAGQPVCH